MVALRFHAEIGEDRKLIIQLPDEMPPGGVELIVRSTEPDTAESAVNPLREAVKNKLLAAGILVTDFEIPQDAVPLTVEQRMSMGTLKPGARDSLDLINEDRGEW